MHHVGHVDWDFSEPPGGYAGSAAGYSSSCLVGGHTGAVHTDLSITKLEPGGWTGLHLHSFESAVYVLAGDPVLSIDGHQNQLRTGDYALLPIGMPHGWANPSGGQARLLVLSTPQRRPAGQRPGDTFFLPADSAVSGHAAPVSRYLGHYAGTPPQQEALRVDDRVRDREPAGMDTALLAYSGISVKMMVDRGLGAELLVMFMVDYEPGGAAQAHDHPFEEAYFFLEGEIDAEVDGLAYQLRAGDVLFAGVGSTHGFYNTGRGRVRWIETQAPQPPGRHSYRWTGPWQRLESQTSGNTGRPWLRT
ncbi:MAG TPA: cupin domain-containing protein [Streptosporangiaceae bacterium]|nr:cupin domain-containing protein [Streptosporangiaceae bacterium]